MTLLRVLFVAFGFLAVGAEAQTIYLQCEYQKVGVDDAKIVSTEVTIDLDAKTVEQDGKMYSDKNVVITGNTVGFTKPGNQYVGPIKKYISREDLSYRSIFQRYVFEGNCEIAEPPERAF